MVSLNFFRPIIFFRAKIYPIYVKLLSFSLFFSVSKQKHLKKKKNLKLFLPLYDIKTFFKQKTKGIIAPLVPVVVLNYKSLYVVST
jgi:hypothetical protein